MNNNTHITFLIISLTYAQITDFFYQIFKNTFSLSFDLRNKLYYIYVRINISITYTFLDILK